MIPVQTRVQKPVAFDVIEWLHRGSIKKARLIRVEEPERVLPGGLRQRQLVGRAEARLIFRQVGKRYADEGGRRRRIDLGVLSMIVGVGRGEGQSGHGRDAALKFKSLDLCLRGVGGKIGSNSAGQDLGDIALNVGVVRVKDIRGDLGGRTRDIELGFDAQLNVDHGLRCKPELRRIYASRRETERGVETAGNVAAPGS